MRMQPLGADRPYVATNVQIHNPGIYGEQAALLALQHPCLHTLQAAQRCAGVLVRSVFLHGVLTARLYSLPAALYPLRQAALRAMEKERLHGCAPDGKPLLNPINWKGLI